MGKIIAVASGKGGTGKTTFTANVALALAHMGQRVLCLDCDITLRNLDLALGLSDRALMDFSDVLEGRCTLHEAAVPHERYPSLSLLTAPMADRPLSLSVPKLQALAREIRESYDWCLIDAPAGLGQGFQMAACMADQVIVITTTDVSAMRDAQRTAAELSAFPSGTVHLVVGRVSKKVLRQLHTTIDDAIDAAGLPLLGVIPEDPDVPYCLNRGLVLREQNYYAARAYETLRNASWAENPADEDIRKGALHEYCIDGTRQPERADGPVLHRLLRHPGQAHPLRHRPHRPADRRRYRADHTPLPVLRPRRRTADRRPHRL